MTAALPARIARIVGRRLVKSFGASVALRGVDVSITPGRLTLLEGPNGSGKTTLLGILGTVTRPTAGEVVYEPLGTDRGAARRVLGWLSHDTLGYGDLSGRKNVEIVADAHGLDPALAYARAAERFQLGSFAERPLRTCSRGQRQRIALARALVHEPSVILLDEPTTGLDRAGVARLREVVREEVDGGAIVVLVSHEPELFADAEPRRIVLERGRVVLATAG